MLNVLITGCSSGIGKATALYLARKGLRVHATARSPNAMDDLKFIAKSEDLDMCFHVLDVTNELERKQVIQKILKTDGKIDVLINNAGVVQAGTVMDVSEEGMKHQFEVNVFAAVELIKLVLPAMLKTKSGRIINISSIASKLIFPITGYYNASKAALEAITDALRMELKRYNIKIISILPGPVKTDFVKNLTKKYISNVNIERSPFKRVYERHLKNLEKSASSGIPPEKVARVIYKAITKKRPKRRYILPLPYKLLVKIRPFIPDFLWEYMAMLYFKF